MGAVLKSTRSRMGNWLWRHAHHYLQIAEQFSRSRRLPTDASVDETSRILPSATIHNLAGICENIQVGARTVVRGELLIFAHGGRIDLGEDCYVGDGARIWSAAEVVIGKRVLISHGVNIHDTDSHPLDPADRHRHFRDIMALGHPTQLTYPIQSAPVCIADDVWIGFGATILKGVSIGARSIIAAASVVTRDIPAGVMAAGNPAKVVKAL